VLKRKGLEYLRGTLSRRREWERVKKKKSGIDFSGDLLNRSMNQDSQLGMIYSYDS
jgi:hypothetical protein